MTTPDRFAIIPIPPGPVPDNVIITGPLDLIMQNLPDTHARQDAIEELELARISADKIKVIQDANRAIQVAAFCDSVSHITRRLDQFEARRDARIKAEAAAREQEEQQQIAEALSKLPDPDSPHEWESDYPSGELNAVSPAKTSSDSPDVPAVIDPDKPQPDSEGDLPTALTNKVPPTSGTQTEFAGPPDPDERSDPVQPTARNPVAVGLM